MSSSSLTNGNILSIQNTAASATSTGKVLSISDATTGSGYGVYSAMTATANTGYAGYFTNSSTNSGYGVYVSSTGGATSTVIPGYFTTASSYANAALEGIDTNTGGGIGIYGQGTTYGVEGNGGYSGGGGVGVYGTNAQHRQRELRC